ncbi:hypothetical protein [Phenylobacterium sp.]|uniref:hypothetical protein n=1 Tax=Phenylobacterium sp. TaxID=1871053 RepID=UPI00273045B0|nr:hypothetical protein [Phenylobacterium sp.]MDP1873801.1 hypothetical protein [Phenylobacterium sp.]
MSASSARSAKAAGSPCIVRRRRPSRELARAPRHGRKNHPEFREAHSTYRHDTPEVQVDARQYPNYMLPLFLDFVDQIWIPNHAERYFGERAPDALPYLPRLLPSLGARPARGLAPKQRGIPARPKPTETS